MAVIAHSRSRGPRASSRRSFRAPAALPQQPAGVEVLAAVQHARCRRCRVHAWDARLETSCIAVLAYLWRRGRGERWAGRAGSARFACSIAQLVMGIAPIMGWRDIPQLSTDKSVEPQIRRARHQRQVARFVRKHRASVQRWLDWLEAADLVSHTPQQDEEGFWWRTIITLHSRPQLDAELLAQAVERRAGWPARERRRQARGRLRNLTAILRRSRLSRAQRRARSVARRRELECRAQRVRVRVLVAESLAAAAKTHMGHPFGASTTSRTPSEDTNQHEPSNRGHTGARTRTPKTLTTLPTQTTGTQEHAGRSGQETRWAVYNEVRAARFTCPDEQWARLATGAHRRREQVLDWPTQRPCPRWWLIELWAHAAHGSEMALAGGFRLAFWSEQREHHGPRLERALARYARYAHVRPAGWPASPVAALAHFITTQCRKQQGPEHGMAYDTARFNSLTKGMSAYAHYQRPEHLESAGKRAQRRKALTQLANAVNSRLRLSFRAAGKGPQALLRRAAELLDSDHPTHHTAGRTLYAAAQRQQRIEQRDERLLAGQHPGLADGRYLAGCRYAERWGLPAPGAVRPVAQGDGRQERQM